MDKDKHTISHTIISKARVCIWFKSRSNYLNKILSKEAIRSNKKSKISWKNEKCCIIFKNNLNYNNIYICKKDIFFEKYVCVQSKVDLTWAKVLGRNY